MLSVCTYVCMCVYVHECPHVPWNMYGSQVTTCRMLSSSDMWIPGVKFRSS